MPELLVRGIPGLHAHWYLDGNEYVVQVFGGHNKTDGWWASAEATNGNLANIYAHEHYEYEIDALMALECKMGSLGELEKEADAETWTPPKALVVFGKDIETARAIIRAALEEHGIPWEDWMYKGQVEIDTEEGA